VTEMLDVQGEFVSCVLDISFHSVPCLLPGGIVAKQRIRTSKCLFSHRTKQKGNNKARQEKLKRRLSG
jgi:hypothetical protein